MYFNDWLTCRELYTPDRVAVTDIIGGRDITYADLNSQSIRLAAWLRERFHLNPGDRLVCIGANSLEYLVLYFACGKLGCVLVPLNTRLPEAARGWVPVCAAGRASPIQRDLTLSSKDNFFAFDYTATLGTREQVRVPRRRQFFSCW